MEQVYSLLVTPSRFYFYFMYKVGGIISESFL